MKESYKGVVEDSVRDYGLIDKADVLKQKELINKIKEFWNPEMADNQGNAEKRRAVVKAILKVSLGRMVAYQDIADDIYGKGKFQIEKYEKEGCEELDLYGEVWSIAQFMTKKGLGVYGAIVKDKSGVYRIHNIRINHVEISLKSSTRYSSFDEAYEVFSNEVQKKIDERVHSDRCRETIKSMPKMKSKELKDIPFDYDSNRFESSEYRKMFLDYKFGLKDLVSTRDQLSLMDFSTVEELGKWAFVQFIDAQGLSLNQEGQLEYVDEVEGKKILRVGAEYDKKSGDLTLRFYDRGELAMRMVYNKGKLQKVAYMRTDKEHYSTTFEKKKGGVERKDYVGAGLVKQVNYNKFGAPVLIVDAKGNTHDLGQDAYFWDIAIVRMIYPSITEREFIGLLATWLNSKQKLEFFIQNKMEYTPDTNVKGKYGKHIIPADGAEPGELFQYPFETVARYDSAITRYRGDCDDYAFLLRAVLRLQGKKAFAIGLPGHATCVWIEKGEDGGYVLNDAGSVYLYTYTGSTKAEVVQQFLNHWRDDSDEVTLFHWNTESLSKDELDKLKSHGSDHEGGDLKLKSYELWEAGFVEVLDLDDCVNLEQDEWPNKKRTLMKLSEL